VDGFLEQSKKYQAECAELGIKFIDTGVDRKRKLEEFVQVL
jgi:hypothetical protein